MLQVISTIQVFAPVKGSLHGTGGGWVGIWVGIQTSRSNVRQMLSNIESLAPVPALYMGLSEAGQGLGRDTNLAIESATDPI